MTEKINVSRWLNALKYIILFGLFFIYLLPLIWILSVSLKSNSELMVSPFLFPNKIIWENYKNAWNLAKLGQAIVNSFFVASLATIGSLFIGCMSSFVIGRMKLEKHTRRITLFFSAGMMIPLYCVLVPVFKMYVALDWTNSRLTLSLAYIGNALPQTIYILTGFFKGMQNELFEAACIDGCSFPKLFLKIGLPLARNGLFVMGLLNFVSYWNDLLEAMIMLSDKEVRTLPVVLTAFVGPYSVNYTEMFAAIVISILPSITIYSLFSNSITTGINQGAIK